MMVFSRIDTSNKSICIVYLDRLSVCVSLIAQLSAQGQWVGQQVDGLIIQLLLCNPGQATAANVEPQSYGVLVALHFEIALIIPRKIFWHRLHLSNIPTKFMLVIILHCSLLK